jgi:hypothetical protein
MAATSMTYVASRSSLLGTAGMLTTAVLVAVVDILGGVVKMI